MNCRELAELLLDFVNGELAAEQCQCLEEHMHACPPCEVYVETYRLTIRLTRQLPCAGGELPEHLWCRCEEMLKRECGG